MSIEDVYTNSLGAVLTLIGTTLNAALTGALPTKFEIVHTSILAFITLCIGFFGTMMLKWIVLKIFPNRNRNEENRQYSN